ncbi:glycosyltransferase family 2 protein [Candidatus Roizmanbacteria bacterium]|nr:glycosyltransferase family 2 protein [Candidatus Roizmanbacteria bacterium]
MTKPTLSIVVVSYNTAETTRTCLVSIQKSLAATTIAYEIIVVDNNSQDETKAGLKKISASFPQLQIIVNTENVGFGKANNQGASRAKGEYLLFLNSDTEVLNDAITKIFTYYRQHQTAIHFLGGRLLNPDRTPQPSCGPFYTLPVVFGALFLKGDYWGLTRSSPSRARTVDWVSGACLLTKKEYFETLSGFDEGIFMYMEEIDLLYRAKKINLKTAFYPDARFIHIGFASSGQKTYPVIQVYRGFLYFYHKHYGRFSLFVLKSMLQLKAVLAIIVGKIRRNAYLTKTYEQSYEIVALDR